MIHMNLINVTRIAILAMLAIVSTTGAPVQTTSQAQVSAVPIYMYSRINLYTHTIGFRNFVIRSCRNWMCEINHKHLNHQRPMCVWVCVTKTTQTVWKGRVARTANPIRIISIITIFKNRSEEFKTGNKNENKT